MQKEYFCVVCAYGTLPLSCIFRTLAREESLDRFNTTDMDGDRQVSWNEYIHKAFHIEDPDNLEKELQKKTRHLHLVDAVLRVCLLLR